MAETRALADFVARSEFEDLPHRLIDRCKVYVVDNLAAGFIGSLQPWTQTVASVAETLGGNPVATCFNRGKASRFDASRAALVNGAAMGAFESEHIGHASHPSSTVFPAALAIAESHHLSGRALITALLLGYEVVCRVGEAQTPAVEIERGFHNPGANGTFGAAAAVGKLLGLDGLHLAWAFGIAGSSSGGLVEFVWEGAMTKRIHLGRASQLGLESALLAKGGLTGPTTVLEGPYGYLHAFSPHPDVDKLVAGLGERWLAEDLTIKAYPLHSTAQAIVHAIRLHPLDPSQVRHVKVTTPRGVPEKRYMNPAPTTMLGAQYSLPFCIALALTRDLSDPATLTESVLGDDLLRRIAATVEVRSDPSAAATVLEIETNEERRTFTADSFPGSPGDPLDFDAASDKLRRYARAASTPERISRMIEIVHDLEQLEDTAHFAALIASP